MRAVVLHRPGDAEVLDLPDPEPGPGELLLEVTGAGLCGTDVHIYDGAFPPASYPLVPGHEFAGRVAALGRGVDGFAVGEEVAADCTLACGRCRYCRSGAYNLCARWGAIGDTVDGAFAEYVRVPVANVFAWPRDVPHEWAPLTEPMACVLRGCERLGPVAGAHALVVGAGVIGALAAKLLRLFGATVVDVCERSEERRTRAARGWADQTSPTADEPPREQYGVAVDATGAVAAIAAAIERLAPGGRCLVLGMAPEEALAGFSPYRLVNRELTVIGSMSKRYSFQPTLDLVGAGAIDLASLLEAPRPLDDYRAAVQQVREGVGMKPCLSPWARPTSVSEHPGSIH